MKWFINYLLFLNIFYFSSCTTDLVTDLEQPENTLVINSLFTTDSCFRVRIGCLNDIFSRINTYYFTENWMDIYDKDTTIKNIEVVITDETGETETLQQIYPNQFKSNKITAKINHNYTITAKALNYPAIKSIDKIPPLPHIIKSGYDGFFENSSESSNADFHKIHVVIQDNPEEINYYSIRLIEHELHDKESRYLNLKSYDPFIETKETSVFSMPEELIFSDKFLRENEFETNVLFLSYGSEKYLYLIVELRSVSESYYLFKKKMQEPVKNGSFNPRTGFNIQGEPVYMYSNVTNGLGIFAGYSIDRDTIFFKQ